MSSVFHVGRQWRGVAEVRRWKQQLHKTSSVGVYRV